MIKNERQYRITSSQAAKFEYLLKQLDEHQDERAQMDPILRQAEENGIRSILAGLHAELEEYRNLKSGNHKALEFESFLDLPQALIQARIASGLSQKELAERLAIKPQQVQHYEATKYAGASFVRLYEIISALHLKISFQVDLPGATGIAGGATPNQEVKVPVVNQVSTSHSPTLLRLNDKQESA